MTKLPPILNRQSAKLLLTTRLIASLIGILCFFTLTVKPANCQNDSSSVIAASIPRPADLYKLSLQANERYTYSARQFITTWREDGTASASVEQIYHLAPNLDKIVYTAPRTRGGVTIIEDSGSHQEWTLLPERNVLVHGLTSTVAKPDISSEITLVLANYSFVINPKPEQVGGRKAYLVNVVRRWTGKRFEHLWIDPFTGLVLRQEKFNLDGALSSVTYLDAVNLHANLQPSGFTQSIWEARKPRLVEKLSKPETPVNPIHLPAPFKGNFHLRQTLDGYALMNSSLLRHVNGDSLHLLYSDGLTVLSIYATPRSNGKPTKMSGSREAHLTPTEEARILQRYSYWLVNWDTPGMTYTVAGDISLQSIMQVARLQYAAAMPPAPLHSSKKAH